MSNLPSNLPTTTWVPVRLGPPPEAEPALCELLELDEPFPVEDSAVVEPEPATTLEATLRVATETRRILLRGMWSSDRLGVETTRWSSHRKGGRATRATPLLSAGDGPRRASNQRPG